MSEKKSIFDLGDKFGYESPFGDWIEEMKEEQKDREKSSLNIASKEADMPIKTAKRMAIHSNLQSLRDAINNHISNENFCALLGFVDKEQQAAVERIYGGKSQFNAFLLKSMNFATQIYRSNGITFHADYYGNADQFLEYSIDGDYGGKMFLDNTAKSSFTEYTGRTTYLLATDTRTFSKPLTSYKILGFFIAHEYFHQLLGRLGYILYENTNYLSNTSGQHTNFKDYYNLNTEGSEPVSAFKMPFDKRFYRIWKPQLHLLKRYNEYVNTDIKKLNKELQEYLNKKKQRSSVYLTRVNKVILSGINLEDKSSQSWEIEKETISDQEIFQYLHKFNI